MAVLAQCLTQTNIYWRNAENEVFFKFISKELGWGLWPAFSVPSRVELTKAEPLLLGL